LLWFFRDRTSGRITIAQAPNWSLWIVIVAGVLRTVARPSGAWGTALDLVFKGALLLWALDEVARGVNPWRRCLGAGVILFLALSLLMARSTLF
jgi:hypothetical protein